MLWEMSARAVVVVVVAVGLDRAVAVHFPLLRLAVKVTRRPRQSTGKWKRSGEDIQRKHTTAQTGRQVKHYIDTIPCVL